MKTSVKNRLLQVIGALALLLGIVSCDMHGPIEITPKNVTLSGEAQEITLKTTNEITLLFVKEGRDDSKRISAPSSQTIEGDWYTVSYDPISKKKIFISVTENGTGESRSIQIKANRKGRGDQTTITQLSL